MKFDHLNVPKHWQNYWTRYPEGHTILEALISWVSQVDDMVDNVNSWNEYLNNFVATFDKELQTEVTQTLSDWQNSGFLEVVVSEALQWQLTDYIATNEADKLSLETQLQQTEQSLNAQLAHTVTLITPNMTISEIQTNLDNSGLFRFTEGVYTGDLQEKGTDRFLLDIKSNSHIIFDKGTIIQSPTTNLDKWSIINIENKDNITIENGVLVGDRKTHAGVTGEWGHGIYIRGGKNIVIDGITIRDCWGDGIEITRFGGEQIERKNMSKNITVQNSVFDNNRRQGVSVVGLEHGLFFNNEFTNTNGTPPAAGMDIEPDRHCSCTDIRVLSNLFEGNEGNGLDIVVRSNVFGEATVKDVCVEGNSMKNNVLNGIKLTRVIDCLVNNNSIIGSGEHGLLLEITTECIITANVIKNNTRFGVYLNQSVNNTLSDLIVVNNSGLGIQLADNSSNNTIRGCQIAENGREGILVVSSSINNFIDGNVVTYNCVTDKEVHQIHVLSRCSYNIISNNKCRGDGTYGVYIDDATSRANRVYLNDCFQAGTVGGVGNDPENNTFYYLGNISNDGTWKTTGE